MEMKRLSLIFILITLSLGSLGQTSYWMGCLPEPDPECLPQQADLLTKDLEYLPLRYSLEAYCPVPQSQGQYGTCTGWATAYAFRSILEAVNRGWTDKTHITDEAFSPIFLYARIKKPDDMNCSMGSVISHAFAQMKDIGVAKKRDYDLMCSSFVPNEVLTTASRHKIANFQTIINNYFNPTSQEVTVQKIKKAIANKQPVVISMKVYPSFFNCKDVWNGDKMGKFGLHAMCVVGYDDEKYGGAFRIMNSWGTKWGDNGFVWVRYPDFCKTLNEAYTGSLPFNPSPVDNKNKFGGSLDLTLSTGASLKSTLRETDRLPIYDITGSFMSGTRFRLYISNEEPAYVYVLGFDSQKFGTLLFPPKDNISAALPYKNTHIAIPDEKWYLEMDDKAGTDYFCVLYSKNELNIKDILKKIENGTGPLDERISTALMSKLAKPGDIKYTQNSMKFAASTDATVIPIIVSLSHK